MRKYHSVFEPFGPPFWPILALNKGGPKGGFGARILELLKRGGQLARGLRRGGQLTCICIVWIAGGGSWVGYP